MDRAQLSKIGAALARALDADTLMRMARSSGFCQRMRSVTPQELVVAVIAAMATQNTETIADIQRTFNALTGRSLAYKPFHNKLRKPSFAEMMRMVVEHLLDELVLSVAADTEGARHYLPEPEELTGRLLIGDRGYQHVDYCRKVDKEGGFVLLRDQTQIDTVVVACLLNSKATSAHDGQRLHAVMRRRRGRTIDVDAQWKGIGGDRRPDTRLRVVLIWNPRRRDHMALVTNLDRVRFSPTDIYQIYRLRWQVELLFKEWKSYCNLHAFGTTKAPIAEGLMWAALAACILKRFMAKAAQKVFDVGEVSTRKTVMTIGHHLYALLDAVLCGYAVRHVLLALLRHLSTQALRAHPERDRRAGRLRLGILPVTA